MTYKVKATMTLEVIQEVEADSEEEAIDNFYKQSVSETIDDATYIEELDSDITEIEIAEADYKIRVKGIDYCIEYYDLADQVEERFPEMDPDSEEFDNLVYSEIEKVRNALPQSMDIEIDGVSPDDLEDYIADAISDETGWLINGYESYEILETR